MKVFETGEQGFVNPGDNPVTLPAEGKRARFVRVTVTRLYNRGQVIRSRWRRCRCGPAAKTSRSESR